MGESSSSQMRFKNREILALSRSLIRSNDRLIEGTKQIKIAKRKPQRYFFRIGQFRPPAWRATKLSDLLIEDFWNRHNQESCLMTRKLDLCGINIDSFWDWLCNVPAIISYPWMQASGFLSIKPEIFLNLAKNQKSVFGSKYHHNTLR